jgi:hypothetical protein
MARGDGKIFRNEGRKIWKMLYYALVHAAR